MSPDSPGPMVHYYMIRGGKFKKNVTVWAPGAVGGEYIKTYGHYHIGELDETYWVVQGSGVILQQKMVVEAGETFADRIEEFKAIQVRAGDSVYMPPHYGHLGVNVGSEWLVTTDDSPVEGSGDNASMPGHADYTQVQRMRGFAYYVVEHNGAPALKKNPRYTEVRASDFGGLSVVE
jgi:glucose-6-phosphate isomerase, archaeal